MGQGKRPAAKLFQNLEVAEICDRADLDRSAPVIEFTIVADNRESRTSVELDKTLRKKLRGICTHVEQARVQRRITAFRLPGMFKYPGFLAKNAGHGQDTELGMSVP